MRRRSLLTGATGAALALPALLPSARAQSSSKVLRFVPVADLSNLDPVWATAYNVRNAGFLVWDTLYGVDDQHRPRRQMVESEEVSADGRVWTFTLRPGQVFHDGEPVRAKDAVASLKRWAARDPMGQQIVASQESLVAVDDRTFRWTLQRPFPKMLFALAKSSTPCSFVFPERIAQTDPFKQITEFVGSGPMRFLKGEWVQGAKAAFERFPGYVPRDEPGSWMAGGKRIHFDRIEWITLPDPATAAAALRTGEVDWVQSPQPDLIPMLEQSRGVRTGVVDPLGTVMSIRLNQLQPPFNNREIRRALLMALNQDDYASAVIGDDPALRRNMYGYFTPDTPLYNEVGGEILKRPRDPAAAKAAILQAGYKNEPVVLLAVQDIFHMKAAAEVSGELFRQIGLNVQVVATDFATMASRRANKGPVSQGGWSAFSATHAGTDCINPASYIGLRSSGERAWFGWPDSPKVEAGIRAWFDAPDLDAEKVVARQINADALEHVVFAPTGFFLNKHAWRAELDGVVAAPVSVFWDVTKR